MARSQHAGSKARHNVPNDPTDLSGRSWLAAARRTLKEYKADDLQNRAAALTYFGIQSIFPGLLVLVTLLGVLGKSATKPLIANLGKAAPASVRKIIVSDVTQLQHSHAASGILGIAGILLALWPASNYAQPGIVPLRSLTVKPSSACLSATSMSSWWMAQSPSPSRRSEMLLGAGIRPARRSAGPRPLS
jgi:virulence factor BrkB